MIWPPFQPPAWTAPASDPAETQQPALSAESSGLAREFSPDSSQVLAKASGLGMGHLVKGIRVWSGARGGVSYISGWAGIHFNPLEEVMVVSFMFWWPLQAEESQCSLLLSHHFPKGKVTGSFEP